MKVIAHLPGKGDNEDAALIEVSQTEFEKIMGLEGIRNKTRMQSLVNRTIKLPNTFNQIQWITASKKKLERACVIMTDFAKQLPELLEGVNDDE